MGYQNIANPKQSLLLLLGIFIQGILLAFSGSLGASREACRRNIKYNYIIPLGVTSILFLIGALLLSQRRHFVENKCCKKFDYASVLIAVAVIFSVANVVIFFHADDSYDDYRGYYYSCETQYAFGILESLLSVYLLTIAVFKNNGYTLKSCCGTGWVFQEEGDAPEKRYAAPAIQASQAPPAQACIPAAPTLVTKPDVHAPLHAPPQLKAATAPQLPVATAVAYNIA